VTRIVTEQVQRVCHSDKSRSNSKRIQVCF